MFPLSKNLISDWNTPDRYFSHACNINSAVGSEMHTKDQCCASVDQKVEEITVHRPGWQSHSLHSMMKSFLKTMGVFPTTPLRLRVFSLTSTAQVVTLCKKAHLFCKHYIAVDILSERCFGYWIYSFCSVNVLRKLFFFSPKRPCEIRLIIWWSSFKQVRQNLERSHCCTRELLRG